MCGKFCGIDISQKTVERAEENLDGNINVKLICGDFLTYKFDCTFDVIYSSITFMHIEDKRSTINKIAGLLNDAGRFVLSIDKNLSGFIDTGNRRIRIYPDAKDVTVKYIEDAGLTVLDRVDTDFASIFVTRKNKPIIGE